AGSPVSGPAHPEAAALGNKVSAVVRGGRPSIARQGTPRKRLRASPGAPSRKTGDGPAGGPEKTNAPAGGAVGECNGRRWRQARMFTSVSVVREYTCMIGALKARA